MWLTLYLTFVPPRHLSLPQRHAISSSMRRVYCMVNGVITRRLAGPILSVFSALIVHSEIKSVHPGFPVAFIF